MGWHVTRNLGDNYLGLERLSMHILMLVSTDVNNDPRVMKEATTLVRAGYHTSVIGLKRRGTESSNETLDGIQIRRLDPWHRRLSRWLKGRRGLATTDALLQTSNGATAAHGSQLVGWLHQIQATLDILLLEVMFGFAALRNPVDIVHAHDVDTLFAGLLCGWLRRKPVIYDTHEYWYAEHRNAVLPRTVVRVIERFGSPKCACIFAVSPSIARKMADHYGIPVPIVLMNVPATTPIPILRPLNRGRPVSVLYHGGYAAKRGLEELILAIKYVTVPAHLTMRGFGDLELTLRALVNQLGLQDRVTFAPPVPMQDLVAAAAESDIGIIPYSKEHAEFALPNKIFEYMAAGLAVIANDLPEFRNVIVRHDIGAVCDTENPVELAHVIDALAGVPVLLEQYRRKAWNVFRQQYTWASHQEVLLNAYHELAAKS